MNRFFTKLQPSLPGVFGRGAASFNSLRTSSIQQVSCPIVVHQLRGNTWSRASANDATKIGGFTYPAPRKLSDITKIQLLEKVSSARVSEIWKEYHSTQKTSVADVLSQSAYEMLKNRTSRCPLFALPVPREQGFFTLLVQFQGRQVLFTFLEDYKRNATGAMPYLTITFFEELLARKHIALMRADVTNMLTKPEAETIWKLLTMFYLTDGRLGFDSVVRFNEQPNAFDFNVVLRAAGLGK